MSTAARNVDLRHLTALTRLTLVRLTPAVLEAGLLGCRSEGDTRLPPRLDTLRLVERTDDPDDEIGNNDMVMPTSLCSRCVLCAEWWVGSHAHTFRLALAHTLVCMQARQTASCSSSRAVHVTLTLTLVLNLTLPLHRKCVPMVMTGSQLRQAVHQPGGRTALAPAVAAPRALPDAEPACGSDPVREPGPLGCAAGCRSSHAAEGHPPADPVPVAEPARLPAGCQRRHYIQYQLLLWPVLDHPSGCEPCPCRDGPVRDGAPHAARGGGAGFRVCRPAAPAPAAPAAHGCRGQRSGDVPPRGQLQDGGRAG